MEVIYEAPQIIIESTSENFLFISMGLLAIIALFGLAKIYKKKHSPVELKKVLLTA